MKKSYLYLLPFMTIALSGCSDTTLEYSNWKKYDQDKHVKYCLDCKDESKKEIYADHVWGESKVTTAPTHLKEGLMELVCNECGEVKSVVIPALTEHTFNRLIASSEYLQSEATCTSPAIYYKSCECGAKGQETFEYGLKENHKIKSISIKKAPTKVVYGATETFDPTGLEIACTCANCGEIIVPNNEIVFSYPGNRSWFKPGDTYVTANYQGQKINIEGLSVLKVHNSFVDMSDVTTSCHAEVNFNNFKAIHGETTIVVKDKNNNIVTDYTKLEEEYSPYVVHSSAPETDEFDAVEGSATITVNHNVHLEEEKYSDECYCGYTRIKNYFYNLETSSVETSLIDGHDKDAISSYEIIDSETGVAPDFSSATGGQEFKLIARKGTDEIHFKGIAINKLIKTASDFQSLICPTSTKEAAASTRERSGYYVLGNDITGTTKMMVPMQTIKDYFGITTTPSGQQYIDYNNAHKFSATLDGLGHKIANLTDSSHTYVGIFGGMLDGATIKNISFENVKIGYSENGGNYQLLLFGHNTKNTTFENVNIKLAAFGSNNYCAINNVSVFGLVMSENNTFRNICVDCNNLDVQRNPDYSGQLYFTLYGNSGVTRQTQVPTIENVSVINTKNDYEYTFVRVEKTSCIFTSDSISGFTSFYKSVAA